MSDKTVNLFPPEPDPYGKIAGVAARLGIGPTESAAQDSETLYIQLADGARYDLFAIIHALIDKMEQRA